MQFENILHCHMRELRIAADGLLDPADVRWDTGNDALSTVVEPKTVDANNSPRALLIFTRQWTSTVTLSTQHRSTLTLDLF